MISKKVKAVFKGQNGSCGYETNKEYILVVGSLGVTSKISIHKSDGSGPNNYSSILTFLDNWDNVRVID
jgi:hypothetical protein